MKSIFCLVLCWISYYGLKAQPLPDSVKMAFNAAQNDVEKGRVLINYFDMNADNSSIFMNQVELKKYFEKEKMPVFVDYVNMAMCRQRSRGAEYVESLRELFLLMPRFGERKDEYGIMVCNRHLSYAYYAAGDSNKTLYYDRITVRQSLALEFKDDIAVAYNNIAADMAEYGYSDSADHYARNAVRIAYEINHPLLIAKTLSTTGEGFIVRKEYDSAIIYIRKSLPIARVHSQLDHVYGLNDLAQIYYETHRKDSTIFYATAAASIASEIRLMNQVMRSYQYLYKAYNETGPLDSAYKYLQLTVAVKDSIYGADKTKQVEMITVREQDRQREVEQQKLEFTNKIRIYALLAGLAVFGIIGLMLYRYSRKEKNAKLLLQKKNDTIEKTLSQLKSTQAQLIQSEKMASLGELTAGIAHEIQNPLNFVNNFSEINKELIDELQQELKAGKIDAAIDISNDVKDNEEKINAHGKRADAIVKGMLLHSRSSSGHKEATDINALCDEYLRLAYHGLRAKDNSFNATINTDFDEKVGRVAIIPQDLGRVVMNLLTNAFYAANEKKQQEKQNFEPTVSISTRRKENSIEIRVSDNGKGIPANIIEKIFQPFFTTKPTGKGTGLGLSLSYDIITKGHGGELIVESMEGEGTEFIIVLPLKNR